MKLYLKTGQYRDIQSLLVISLHCSPYRLCRDRFINPTYYSSEGWYVGFSLVKFWTLDIELGRCITFVTPQS
jgi:hypothetical protein